MRFNLKEKAINFYRILLLILPEGTRKRIIKKWTYTVALFLAKRSGRLPYFYSKQEKEFDSLSNSQQYHIGLNNNVSSVLEPTVSLSDNNLMFKIGIIVSFKNDTVLFEKTLNSIISQTYKNWNLSIICPESQTKAAKNILQNKNLHDVKILTYENDKKKYEIFNKLISHLEEGYITFLDCNGILYPDSLNHLALKVQNHDFDIIYADEDHMDTNNFRFEPFFKPSWSPHLLLSFNYFGKFVIYSVKLLQSINGFDESLEKANEYDLSLRASEKSSKIIHIPKVLFSKYKGSSEITNIGSKLEYDRIALQRFLKNNGFSSNIEINSEGFFVIKSKLKKNPLVSIIIPTKNNISKLKLCLQTIKKSSYQNFEIIIVTNSKKIETRKFLNSTGHRVVEFNEPFNFSKMNNFAVKQAKGEYFLFLNDDTEVINHDWLESLLFYAVQQNVGVVGALLLYPESRFYPTSIQHAGVLIGVSGIATHAFAYSHYNKKHYFNLDKVPRDVGAVTAACMMVRADVFRQINGFDENFIVAFGDTDLCLRVREKGHYVVYNPNVKLYHHESASRGFSYPINDEISFLNRWEDSLIRGDEFYNPNLSHLDRNFRLTPYFSDIIAVSALLEVYFFRKDLQQRFPEVQEKKINKLLDWAATEGVSSDISRIGLVSYGKYYLENCSSQVKIVAEAIYKFNHITEIQLKFPEVLKGQYERLLSYCKRN